MVILDGDHSARLERPRQGSDVRFGFREEEKHPADENQIVGRSWQRRVDEIALPHAIGTKAIAPAQSRKTGREYRRALDNVYRPLHAVSQLEMQRTLTRPHLEHLPSAADADAIEQVMRNRIPQRRLKREPGGFSPRIAKEVPIAGRAFQWSVRPWKWREPIRRFLVATKISRRNHNREASDSRPSSTRARSMIRLSRFVITASIAPRPC